MSPQRGILLYYFIALVAATLLLSIPAIYRSGGIPFIDTLFVAASALSVTGLSTVTIVETFNVSGYILLMFIMNLGGIGIMAVGTLLWILLGRRIGVKERRQIITDTNQYKISGAVKLVLEIIVLLFVVEIIGGIIYISYFLMQSNDFSYALLHGSFLSVSATTNGGLDLFKNSLTGYDGNWFIQIPVMCQIILGAIGYPVLVEIKNFCSKKSPGFRFSLFTKVATSTYGILLLIGALIIYILESTKYFADKSIHDSLMTSLFLSTTTRSGGITTVPISQLDEATQLIMSVLMFIGASPSSAGGGIRTTTFAILILFLISFSRGRQHINIFHRRIAKKDIERAFVVFVLAISLVFLGIISVLVVDGHQFTLTQIIFEVTSAFGTTGTSTGITEGLSATSKVIIMLFMFIGRIGFITFLLSIAGRQRELTYKYSEERLMVG